MKENYGFVVYSGEFAIYILQNLKIYGKKDSFSLLDHNRGLSSSSKETERVTNYELDKGDLKILV